MRRLIGLILCFCFLFVNATSSRAYFSVFFKTKNFYVKRKIIQDQDISKQVKETFDAVRKNKTDTTLPEEQARLDNLRELGEQVIPYLEPYLNDINVGVRMKVIKLAFEIGGEKSLNLFAKALRNSNLPITKNVADRLFYCYSQSKKSNKDFPASGGFSRCNNFPAEKIAANPRIGSGLKELVKSGNSFVSATFLLANFLDDETKEILRKFDYKKSLKSGKKPSIVGERELATAIVLASAGEDEAAAFLLKTIGKSKIETLEFLLKNIVEINTAEVLTAMLKTFDVNTLIEGKPIPRELAKLQISKGLHIDLMPPRRLCDLAVNSFVEKFDLQTSFQLHTTTYAEKQISEARNMSKQMIAAK